MPDSTVKAVTRVGPAEAGYDGFGSDVKIIQVKVKPRARVGSLEETGTGVWLARLRSPPVDGKANKELLALVAEHFNVPKSAVSIKSGASGRVKWVQLEEGQG